MTQTGGGDIFPILPCIRLKPQSSSSTLPLSTDGMEGPMCGHYIKLHKIQQYLEEVKVGKTDGSVDNSTCMRI